MQEEDMIHPVEDDEWMNIEPPSRYKKAINVVKTMGGLLKEKSSSVNNIIVPSPPIQPVVATSSPESSPIADREKMEAEIIKSLLTAYFNIIRKNVSDSVPKSIMFFLVNKSKSNLQSELVRNLYKDELFEELLKENDEIASKRKATQKMLAVLQRAQEIINEIRDLKL